SNIIMVGDSVTDIAAAKNAKIESCLVKRKENLHSYNYEEWKFQPDYIVDSLKDLTKI
ncbi:MAG: phosphoglycolate phosphatase, partial [Promethearchaeota archaeon]